MNPQRPSRSAREIEPFWNRIGAITRYPLQSGVLMTIGVLALCRLVLYLPLGFILNVVVTVVLYKYAFQVLRATANGFTEPPEGMSGIEDYLARDQLFLQVIFIAIGFFAFLLLGLTGGVLVSILLALALPGATMTLTIEQSLGAALNPARWLWVAGAIGWAYLALVLLVYMVQVSGAFATHLVPDFIPEFMQLVLVYFCQHYALVVCFHLTGYLILQYHEQLGYTPSAPARPLRKANDEPYQALLDEVEEHTREDRLDQALALLKRQVESDGGTAAVHERYRKLLKITQGSADLAAHTRAWVPILLGQGKNKAALDALREALDADPSFALTDPEHITRLAQQADKLGFWQLALRLSTGYHSRFPNHPDIVPNYLMAARLLAERHNQDSQALALLDNLLLRFGSHPQIDEVHQLRERIAKLAAPAVAKPAR